MVRSCAFPGCEKKMKSYTPETFHRLPLQDPALRQWLMVLQLDLETPVNTLRQRDYRVCSAHFHPEDFIISTRASNPPKRVRLKRSAIPRSTHLAPPEEQILEPIEFSTKEEPSEDISYIVDPNDFPIKIEPLADPSCDEMECDKSSDEFFSDFESSEEEEKQKTTKKTKKKKKNSSSDEWEPPAKGTDKDSDNSEMSVEEEEDEESDGASGLADDGSTPVVCCKVCNSEAKLQCSLMKHEKMFACSKCTNDDGSDTCRFEKLTVRFDDFKNFQIHAKQEHGVTTKRVLCQECGIFYMAPGVANIKKEHVCEYKTKHFVCLNCDKRFRTEKGLRAHTHKLHGSTLHPCKYCLMPFHNRPAKLEHEGTHPKVENPYSCPDCPERFCNILKRNRHLRSHRGPWKHICKTCGKGFPHLERLERHELIHSGEKPFTCEVCNRSFSQDGHLKSHMRLHTGEKPYQCKFCEKCFNHNVSLKSHILRYHSSESLPTDGAMENSVPKGKRKRLHPIRPRGRPKRGLGNEEQEYGESHELS